MRQTAQQWDRPVVSRALPGGGARVFLLFLAVFMASGALFAQNYSWDARNVGMGGETEMGTGNLASDLVPQDRNYTSIVVPLGFIQVFSNLKVFDPK